MRSSDPCLAFRPIRDNRKFQNIHIYNATQRIIIRFQNYTFCSLVGYTWTTSDSSDDRSSISCICVGTENWLHQHFCFPRSQFPRWCCDWHQAGYPSSQDFWSSAVSAWAAGFPAASDGEWRSEVQRRQWQGCYLSTVHTTTWALLLWRTLAHHSRYIIQLDLEESVVLNPFLFPIRKFLTS